jgi:hypothetical protein
MPELEVNEGYFYWHCHGIMLFSLPHGSLLLFAGTPLTHERFLRRTRGSYGPRVDVGKGQTLPGHKTPLKGFYLCGDYTFPSIGVPATAASGAITANTIVSVSQHLKMLQKIKLPPRSV